jgi:hypothetical protein
MRSILAALFMTIAMQSSAQTAVYEFSDKTLQLFLICNGDTSNEKMNVELNRNSTNWTVRVQGLEGLLNFVERAGPELIYEDLSGTNPIKIKIDLRKFDTAELSIMRMGSTDVIECTNVTDQIAFFLNPKSAGNSKLNEELIFELNEKIKELSAEIDILKLAQQAVETVTDDKIQRRVSFLCAYIRDRYPADYRVLTRRQIASSTGFTNVCLEGN